MAVRGKMLTARLTDGSLATIDLNTNSRLEDRGYVSHAATVRVTIAPPLLEGDYNYDGLVDAADITVWKDALASQTILFADGNRNGIIDAADYTIWEDQYGQRILHASVRAVPEGSGSWLVLCLSFYWFRCQRRVARIDLKGAIGSLKGVIPGNSLA
ncbi:MAG: hypothetical protein KDA99_05565 [Planctomycetales bacterium]|nr:hypothetical protein [Planctomycetales bacterium]